MAWATLQNNCFIEGQLEKRENNAFFLKEWLFLQLHEGKAMPYLAFLTNCSWQLYSRKSTQWASSINLQMYCGPVADVIELGTSAVLSPSLYSAIPSDSYSTPQWGYCLEECGNHALLSSVGCLSYIYSPYQLLKFLKPIGHKLHSGFALICNAEVLCVVCVYSCAFTPSVRMVGLNICWISSFEAHGNFCLMLGLF